MKLVTKIPKAWQPFIGQKALFEPIEAFLKTQAHSTIYPEVDNIFKALELTSLDQCKVVIIGQDPYHGEGQAQGLSFSVPKHFKLPPSLKNIYKELAADLNITLPDQGDLTTWAQQGVLMLNAVLTVEKAKANAHQKKGWEQVTDQIIRIISQEKEHCVFVLWGAFAQKKQSLIDINKHTVIKGHHPSPLSAYRGFFGSRPFSKINLALEKHEQKPINWSSVTQSNQLQIFDN